MELKDYLKKVDNLTLNKDQKALIKTILKQTSLDKLQNVFDFLTKRLKTGFIFDIAPEINTNKLALLVKDKKLSFKNTQKYTENLNSLIIGENYDALKNLVVIETEKQLSGNHFNYDVIYIDPPYNTESLKGEINSVSNDKENIKNYKFIYRDKFSRNSWLNMMAKRLQLAKKLLTENGVIFVSIDDSEQAYLKVLMDGIFGEENFVNNFMWLHGKGKKNKFSRTLQEYCLCYAKNKKQLQPWTKQKITNYEDVSNPDNDPRGNWFSGSISFSESRSNKKHRNYYEITSPSGIIWKRQWQVSKQKMDKLLKDNLIYFGPAPEYKNVPRLKKFNNKIETVIPTNFFEDCGTTRSAKNELYSIVERPLNKNEEHTPKPVKLLIETLKLIDNKNARVLDFFAGSATTAQAVMQLNREDGGNRTYTLVTNNENNTAIDVAYERIYRINNAKGSKGQKFDWLKKNECFNSDLNVYKIKYLDTKNADSSKEIKDTFLKELEDFGIDTTKLKNDDEILLKLNSLNCQKD